MAEVRAPVSIFQCPMSNAHPSLSGECPQPCALCQADTRWTQRAVCPRGFQRQKRSQSLDNGRLCRATQLSDTDASFCDIKCGFCFNILITVCNCSKFRACQWKGPSDGHDCQWRKKAQLSLGELVVHIRAGSHDTFLARCVTLHSTSVSVI